MSLVIVLDFGTSSGRCMVVGDDGSFLSQASVRWPHSMFRVDTEHYSHHFDPDQAWKLIFKSLKKAINQLDYSLINNIKAITVTSQRHGGVFLDKNGVELLGFTNSDLSTTPKWLEIADSYGSEIFNITGRWPQQVFFPSHLSWISSNLPNVYQQIGFVLGIKDWVLYRLSGELVSEPTIAADLMLYDLIRKDYSKYLLDLFDVESDWLPQLSLPGDCIGFIKKSLAEEIGINSHVQVVNGGADTQMACIGLNTIEPKQISIILGSTAPLQLIIKQNNLLPDEQFWFSPASIEDYWVVESNAGDTGLVIDKFIKSYSRNNHKKDSGCSVYNTYEELNNKTKALCKLPGNAFSFMGPTIFHGRYWPINSYSIRGFDINSNAPSIDLQIYLSLLENISFAIKGNLDNLVQFVGGDIKKLSIGGAMVHNTLLVEILKSVINIPIYTPKEVEVSALGTAVSAFTSLGLFDTLHEATDQMCYGRKTYPDPCSVNKYQSQYQRWKEKYFEQSMYENTRKDA